MHVGRQIFTKRWGYLSANLLCNGSEWYNFGRKRNGMNGFTPGERRMEKVIVWGEERVYRQIAEVVHALVETGDAEVLAEFAEERWLLCCGAGA